MYSPYLRVEPLVYDDEKHRKLLLSCMSVLFLVDTYGGAKVITAVLLGYSLFLGYSAIYYYVSFFMRLIEITKTLILFVYSVAVMRLEGCTPLATLAAISSGILNCAKAEDR